MTLLQMSGDRSSSEYRVAADLQNCARSSADAPCRSRLRHRHCLRATASPPEWGSTASADGVAARGDLRRTAVEGGADKAGSAHSQTLPPTSSKPFAFSPRLPGGCGVSFTAAARADSAFQ